MQKNAILNTIHTEFDRCAARFAKNTCGTCNISSEYKGDELPNNLEYRFAQISYDNMVIEFRYTAHGLLGLVNSILECLIYTDKTDSAVAIPLQFACEYLNRTPAIPLSIPLISNKESMQEAFSILEKAIMLIFDDIAIISQNTYDSEKLCDFFGDELCRFYNLKRPEDIFVSDSDYTFLTAHFVSDYYINFFRDDKKSAVKGLGKFKHKSNYDRSVLSIWESDFSFSSIELPALRQSANSYNKSGVQKNDLKEFISVFIPMLLMSPFISVVYVALFLFLVNLEGRDSVYLMGAIYNLPYCFFGGFLTAIPVSYFIRNVSMKILFRKHYERYKEMDDITNGAGSDKFMKGFLWLTILVCLLGCILLPKWNVNFKEDGFVDNSEFWDFRGEYHEYSDIKRIYYIGERTTEFGDTFPYPSYVLEFKDGSEIDFYDFDSIEKYEDELLDHLREKGVKIEGPEK